RRRQPRSSCPDRRCSRSRPRVPGRSGWREPDMYALWFIAGAALLVFTLADAVSTLVTTRNRTGAYWPTNFFYHHSWSLWRQLGKRARNDDRRENLLTGYGPVSLLLILAMWVTLEIVAWSFIWYGMSDA